MKHPTLKYLIPLLFLTSGSIISPVLAHGSRVEYRTTEAITLKASYDNGEMMKNAQVTIYAPNDPQTPWLQATTDEKGEFVFTPDPSIPGNWEVTVRQAGHGNIVSIPVGDSTTEAGETPEGETPPVRQATGSSGGYTPMQKAVMAGLGIWGFVGTALFFTRRNADHAHSR
ncbi:carboxypeptidase-like regulatory domain-containing protein [Spirulina subsalsa FACHB-351]|uniref:Carboxypeptidase-like regulatory domain-containing protein n=1 Tax=Spirulina subsalsa FACHB-351 TaxID=234711 RepID=A0ABT3L4W9_9CYAN|nr:carboxypeptidase-like regulatory domain-containing protein [Spirulina subsalsa]MCW6036551.1 carboxypeptidase-like regulatory domain-containing protein [Spirulina subsalsa FACHB-351]